MLLADATGHDLTGTFRASVTVLDGSDVPVVGVPAFDFSIEIVRDSDGIPTGNFALVFDDDFTVDILP